MIPYKFKEKKKTYILILIFSVIVTFILSGIIFYSSFAYYEEKKNFDVINGQTEEPGDIYFAYYIDGTISRNMPNQNTGYTLDKEKSSCTNGVSINWNNSTWQGITDYTNYNTTTNTRTKCTLYFNKTAKTVKTALGNIEVNTYTPDFTKSACDDSTCESHEKGVFETTDYDGNPTYYYRGSVENNYVKFAGFYWRIVRINSNGSIRMIYDGTVAHDNGEASEDRQYGTSQFNTAYNNNMYVGYMYTSGETHGLGTSSIIKTNVDKFYTDKLTSYTSKLDTTVGYCGDRSTLTLQTGVGIGTTITYNKGHLRVTESTPTLACENESDYYTTSSASNGNKVLTNPIGLITADEVMLAGHAGGTFDGNYNHQKPNLNGCLTIGNPFWTMTPAGGYIAYGFEIWQSINLIVHRLGFIDDNGTHGPNGLRSVINIRSDVTITGSGTKNDPYLVN